MASLSETIRAWFLEPALEFGGKTMAAIDDLNAAISGQYDVLLPAVQSVDSELRRVRDLLANGASAEQLAQALASVNASTNRIKDAVSGLVADTNTPDPAPELPEVPAEPLPEEPVVPGGGSEEPTPAPVEEPVFEVPGDEDTDVPGDGLGAQ